VDKENVLNRLMTKSFEQVHRGTLMRNQSLKRSLRSS